jgi:hypothetical protein
VFVFSDRGLPWCRGAIKEAVMQDSPRVAFLVVTAALLMMLLSGCVATPSRYRDRNGDFIMNIGSTDKVSPTPASIANETTQSAPSSGRVLMRPGA